MTIEEVLGELHHRFQYRNWYAGITIVGDKLIIIVHHREFFEPKILGHIMEQYDYEYEVKILTPHESQR